ncbi:GT2 family glycosyltransferase [Lysinibacillus composti]|uniref:Glycosyltransferase family 2 protein n=1 Tax=Lysinibacillus composti TaxID=720633 RepID=A0A3N9UH74_9BACI|nr:glycosyltransferase family 2 protein [Lysinibacillus composti]MBM7609076.1 GT2 family glycosyltransferase [Lysinibacillus composti]RQW75503.1 glycosyltransferase family 2 protein [Lysinibacillus composti]
MDLSIVIVNYNTKKLTLECIDSIYKATMNEAFEIFMVDNNSSDDSVQAIKETFPEVKVIANKENVGFSRANNQAIKVSKGRYVLLLNSDTIVKETTLSTIIAFMDDHQDIGATGCKVVLPDGTLDKACHRGFPTPEASFYYMAGLAEKYPNNHKYNSYHKSYLDMNEIHEIDCLVGAFMMVRRETIVEVGMLDETYFMYGEDIDWCYRIKEAGWKVYYYPKVSIVHYKGASSRRKPFKIVYEFHRAMFIFHKNHFAPKYNVFINALVYLGISLKLSAAVTLNAIKKSR